MPPTQPFLDLRPERTQLSPSLCADVAMIDRLLGAILSEQADAELLAVARRLYVQGGTPIRALFSSVCPN